MLPASKDDLPNIDNVFLVILPSTKLFYAMLYEGLKIYFQDDVIPSQNNAEARGSQNKAGTAAEVINNFEYFLFGIIYI